MKITCLQEHLSKGLRVAGRAVGGRSTLPVLSNVLLQAGEDGRLKLSGTNLELGITCRVAARVAAPGTVTLPARLLADFVNSLPAEAVEMELNDRTQTMHLACGRFEANIKGIDAQEFPLVPEYDPGAVTVRVSGEEIKTMAHMVAFAAATDESQPILTGVLMRIETECLTMAAADGFRLSVRKTSTPSPTRPLPGGGGSLDAIVPARALNEMARIVENQDEVSVCVTPARNQVLFHTEDVDLASQLVEGKFPDYRQIIPNEHTTRTTLETGALLAAVRIAHLFADQNIVKLGIGDQPSGTQGIRIEGRSAERGDQVGEVAATVEGPGLEIAFNSVYLAQALGVIGTAQVVLETMGASSPGVLRPEGVEDFVHVIMPMHLT